MHGCAQWIVFIVITVGIDAAVQPTLKKLRPQSRSDQVRAAVNRDTSWVYAKRSEQRQDWSSHDASDFDEGKWMLRLHFLNPG